MKTRYPSYYRPKKEDLVKAAETALIVIDTNCLLDLLRVSPQLAEKTLECFKKHIDRIHIPSHSDWEYHRHLSEIPAKILSLAENVRSKFQGDPFAGVLKDVFKGSNGCDFPADLRKSYTDKISAACNEIAGDLTELIKRYRDNFESQTLQCQISELLSARVMSSFSEEEIAKIKEEGKERFANKIPPGYEDAIKADETDDLNCYGDLIIWKEILRLAETSQKDLFFITNDKKGDWIYNVAGKTIGPRIELIVEFHKFAPSKIFHIYRLQQFLELFGDFEHSEIESFSESTSEEAENEVKLPKAVQPHVASRGKVSSSNTPDIDKSDTDSASIKTNSPK